MDCNYSPFQNHNRAARRVLILAARCATGGMIFVDPLVGAPPSRQEFEAAAYLSVELRYASVVLRSIFSFNRTQFRCGLAGLSELTAKFARLRQRDHCLGQVHDEALASDWLNQDSAGFVEIVCEAGR